MESIFLGSFLFGLLMVVASTLLGVAHLALPGGEHGFHFGHGDGISHGHTDAHAHGSADNHGHGGLPLWNISTLLAFLMWFGAAGYTAMKLLDWSAPLALIPAVGFGVAGGLLVSAFLGLVLRGETRMDPREYRMEGTLARVSISIPENGIGEIIFSKGQSRRGEGARSIDGRPIARDEEVVVVDYQRGIALVQRWADLLEEQGAASKNPVEGERSALVEGSTGQRGPAE
jgi:membrane protein implicated in regulation of membrane protease activity